MSDSTSTELDIFADQTTAKFGDSDTVLTVRALIEEITEQGRMTPRLRVYCSQAIKYASIMDQPKSAVAAVNAGIQLTELIENQLTEQQASEGGLLEQLIAALEGDPFE